jgi:hypothetical protein
MDHPNAHWLYLQNFIHKVFCEMADEVRAGKRVFTAVSPAGKRVSLDGALLETITPSDRGDNQITLPSGEIYTDIRFYDPKDWKRYNEPPRHRSASR